MRSTGRDPETVTQGSSGAGVPNPVRRGVRDQPAVNTRRPGDIADSPAAAAGRRTLSTAFVMKGPDGLLTVTLRDGRVLVLRDVLMRPKDYCGMLGGDAAGKRHCGDYGEVATARPGGGMVPEQPIPASSDPVAPSNSPVRRN